MILMALCKLLIRFYKINTLQCCTIGMSKMCFSDNTNSREMYIEADLMDEFTTQLVQSKSEKWARRALKGNAVCKQQITPLKSDEVTKKLTGSHCFNIEEINALCEYYIQNEDYSSVLNLMKQCIKSRKCPKFSVLDGILTYCSLKGEKEIIVQLQSLCQEVQPSLLEVSGKGYFSFFLASAIWVRGDIMKSIALFKNVYKDNIYLRRRIRLSLRSLIADIVTCRSDVALQNIIDFCEYLEEEFNDSYPLQCIWECCFLSEWFSDQALAIDLLETNKGLCDSVSSRIPYVLTISLRSDRVEVVHMLLEFLLRNDRKSETTGLLMMLFDYHLRQNNLSSCSTIMQWCRDNDVTIPGAHSEKFLKLLIKDNIGMRKRNEDTKEPVKYDFKF